MLKEKRLGKKNVKVEFRKHAAPKIYFAFHGKLVSLLELPARSHRCFGSHWSLRIFLQLRNCFVQKTP
ncbi:hypothetical protein BpOF4_04590 [Alkalihalophilus pseudofirmus OF4]|uniref:Uncharacterized protein n=1 Tax=Alkalihalophilus pseudofirmus (strain ATCC BAA-2126 / JCM 17055 / OF4) TaxID=398511 RepID=D3FYU9_ALKPO|nr:hypothetical protein BpOF4_04590 [Alkalihalophilus pseudofirmus OF4]